ncbi:MAG: macro domain-containing protein, partial [Lentisphaerae bacterium]|nr:macro domain-containing protein [Lentisphaerota bacterium]
GYNLKARYVIHTVGPIWHGGSRDESTLLASCYRSSLKVAVENNVKTIAFPCISTGVYRFPKDMACQIALNEITGFLKNSSAIEKVVIACFGATDKNLYDDRLNGMSKC